jgi:hypothetical protein
MAEHLYIGEEDYHGLLTARPKVPDNQVWVFYRNRDNEFPICVWGRNRDRNEEGPKPPRAPWLASLAMQIYKFQQTVTFPWRIQLFEQSNFPVEMVVTVTVTLVDPASYLGTKQFNSSQNQPVKDALVTALRDILSFELQRSPFLLQQEKQSELQIVPITLRALFPKALNSLLPDADLGLYLQNHQIVRKLGVRIRFTVRDTHIPSIYNEIINRSRIKLQKELSDARQLLTVSKGSISIQEGIGILPLRGKLYTDLGQYYIDMRPRVEPVLKTIIDWTAGTAQGNDDPALLAAIFKDIIGMHIEELTLAESIETIVASARTQPTPSTILRQKEEDLRNKHIGELYSVINDFDEDRKHWILSPSRERVNEVILIDIGNNCKIELQVPKGYPKDRPVVKARKDNEAVRQSEVNQVVQPITSKEGYNLISIVKAVAITINPPIPLSLPNAEDSNGSSVRANNEENEAGR